MRSVINRLVFLLRISVNSIFGRLYYYLLNYSTTIFIAHVIDRFSDKLTLVLWEYRVAAFEVCRINVWLQACRSMCSMRFLAMVILHMQKWVALIRKPDLYSDPIFVTLRIYFVQDSRVRRILVNLLEKWMFYFWDMDWPPGWQFQILMVSFRALNDLLIVRCIFVNNKTTLQICIGETVDFFWKIVVSFF